MRQLGYWLTLWSALAAFAVPAAWGGTVYVPLAVHQDLDDIRITTVVRATNTSDETEELSWLFLPANGDGTLPDRETERVTVLVEPRQSLLLDELVGMGERGVLEIEAPPSIAVTARLVGFKNGRERPGTETPVVTSSNLVAANETALLQGWSRVATNIVTDFYILNLGLSEAICEVAAFRRGGSVLASAPITVPPLGLLPIDDVLGALGESKRSEVSADVTCSEIFHPFAVTVNRGSAEIVYIAPSGTGVSSLSPPQEGPPEKPPFTVPCPEDAQIRWQGSLFRPQRGRETRVLEIPMPSGRRFSKITIDLDFTPGDWHVRSDGNHAVVWLNRTRKWGGNVFAYVNVFGPDRSIAKMSTNADLRDMAPMHAFSKKAVFEKDETYHLHYVFDTDRRVMQATFTRNTGQGDEEEVVHLDGTTTTGIIRSEDPGFTVFIGHPTGTVGPEVPTYGWLYSHLCVQIE